MICPECESVDWEISETDMRCLHCKFRVEFDIVTVTKTRYKVLQ